MVETSVLVVGAGPTGLMMALQLARRGVPVQIIDRHPGPSQQTRALGVQARTLEIYAQLGIAEQAVALGRVAAGANLWARGRLITRIPLGDIGRDISPFPYLLILGQDDNEKLLGAALARLGVTVQWNTELVALAEDADGVTAQVKPAHSGPDAPSRPVRARWLAGCDGAKSAVRTLMGVPFVGAPYEQVFFVADVLMGGALVADELNMSLYSQGFTLFFPMRNTAQGGDPLHTHWRIVGMMPEALRDRADTNFADLWPSVQAVSPPGLRLDGCTWFSTYKIQHRRAERFRPTPESRCFLLGDAAHIHSPVGAQGMNTGLQDACNLAWKLAAVALGQASPALLASYEAERLPVAQRLLSTTDQAFKVVISDNFIARMFRSRVQAPLVALAMRNPRIRRLAFMTISQTGIAYAQDVDPPAAFSRPGCPRVGDRFPWAHFQFGAPTASTAPEDLYRRLDDLRFNLLVFLESKAPGSGTALPDDLAAMDTSRVKIHSIVLETANAAELARLKLPGPCMALLRPDGHVALLQLTLSAAQIQRYICY